MKAPSKQSTILAIILWMLSLMLAFKIPPTSKYIWVPDSLLLLGFWPLLISSRARWLWLVFGICNIFIGFVLLVAIYLPEKALVAYNIVPINNHMKLYHPYLSWLLMGVVSTIIGAVRLLIHCAIWVKAKIAN